MTNQEALNHLLNLAVKGEASYHSGYEWSVKYAKELKAYFGDVNIKSFMRKYARRESEALFKQSLEITHSIQGSLGDKLKKSFAKIERSNWTKHITIDGDEDGVQSGAFEKKFLQKFGPKGLFPYVFERLLYWNMFDPNCFTVVEFGAFDNRKENAKPYPFEVTAEMAIDFKYDQSDLIYLCCLQMIEAEDTTGKYDVKRLTLYQAEQTIVLHQLTPEQGKQVLEFPLRNEPFLADATDGSLVYWEDTYYQATIPKPHNHAQTPAARTGYIDNPEDDGHTKLSVFSAALPYAKKMLKVNRELDIVGAILAHPIPFRHEEPCGATGCRNGYLPDDTVCCVCVGTGFKLRPTTAAEELKLALPDTPAEMFDPQKIMGYIHFPVEAAEMLLTLWNKWMEEAEKSIYGSETSTKDEVAQTARYHAIQQEGTKDAIWPYSKHIASFCKYLGECIAAVTGTPQATVLPLIPANIRDETVFHVFEELKAARDAGASSDACAIINARAMEILYQDDPEALKRWRIDDYFNPFRGMTEVQILAALQSTLVPEDKKVFFSNRADIMADILNENPKFYTLDRGPQRDLIDMKVKAIQDKIQAAKPELNIGSLKLNGVN